MLRWQGDDGVCEGRAGDDVCVGRDGGRAGCWGSCGSWEGGFGDTFGGEGELLAVDGGGEEEEGEEGFVVVMHVVWYFGVVDIV